MRAALITSLVLTVFLMGWVANSVYLNYAAASHLETPFSFRYLFTAAGPNRASPADHIAEKDINVYDDRVVLDLKGASWAKYADTKSMDPVFDSSANGIELSPYSPAEIHAGDIISFVPKFTDGLVVHRVMETGIDAQGWFAITRGDNNPTNDPDKVRFGDVHGVLVGIIY